MAFKTKLSDALQACEHIRINGEAMLYSNRPWNGPKQQHRLRLEAEGDSDSDLYVDGDQVIEISDNGNAAIEDWTGRVLQLNLQQSAPLQPETVKAGGGIILE